MTSAPLNASEHLKLLFFALICTLFSWVGLYVGGFIPVLLLIYGYVMMRFSGDFDHISVTVKYAKIYIKALLFLAISIAVVLFVLALIAGTQFYSKSLQDLVYSIFYIDYVRWDLVLAPILVAAALYGILIAIERLYLAPLTKHIDWVLANGAFSRTLKKKNEPRPDEQKELNIIQREALKQFSVADELAKWAKLRDDGVISEADFVEAKSKLMNGR